MKKIVFGRRPQVYLPEISAYINYINTNLDGWSGYDSQEIDDYNPLDFDVVWRFMGFDVRRKGHKVIHEYNSLSTGLFAYSKNSIKKLVNVRPAARVFLNRAVRSQFSFKDDVPYVLRDMGIDKSFFLNASEAKKEYDFVYAGSLKDRGRVIVNALEQFKSHCRDAKLLVIGNVPDTIYNHFGGLQNITFTGRVPYSEVPTLACKACYGLNLMPDIYPLNSQTATKVIEYCALGLPVVSSDYKWVRRFESSRQGRFFFLNKDLSNLNVRDIQKFEFCVPNVKDLEWNNLIQASGIFNLLKS